MRVRNAFPSNADRRLPVSLLLASALLASASGCETATATRVPVSGVVYAKGKELASGHVRFVPLPGTTGPVVVAPVVEGEFALTAENGPLVGTYRIEIGANDFLGFDPGDQAAAELAQRLPVAQRPKNPIPPGYDERSPLIAEVPADGADGLVFLLTNRQGASTERNSSTATSLAVAR